MLVSVSCPKFLMQILCVISIVDAEVHLIYAHNDTKFLDERCTFNFIANILSSWIGYSHLKVNIMPLWAFHCTISSSSTSYFCLNMVQSGLLILEKCLLIKLSFCLLYDQHLNIKICFVRCIWCSWYATPSRVFLVRNLCYLIEDIFGC